MTVAELVVFARAVGKLIEEENERTAAASGD
jgi:hypothetical protein